MVLLSGLVLAGTAAAEEAPVSIGWAAGIETSRGDYGGDVDIEDVYVPFKLTVEGKRIAASLTVPYLSVRAPLGTTVTDPDGAPVTGTGELVTESGLGDVVVGLTVYDVFYSPDLGLALDLTGKLKFGTADADKGLGTGETDVTVIADLVKYYERTTLIGSLGYKVRGEPEDYVLDDVLLGSLGAIIEPGNSKNRVGVFFDYRESSFADEDAVMELSLSVARPLNEKHTLQFFVAKGFGDSAAAWAAGFLFRSR
jgi:hypothetical protein